jgi:hypothetical protein
MPLRHEGLVRIIAADLVGEDAVLEGLAGLRAELDEIEGLLDQASADADDLPHRRTYLLLTQRFARRWLDLNRELLDEVARDFGGRGPDGRAPRRS